MMAGFISKDEKGNGVLTDIVAIVKRKYQEASYGVSCLLWFLECLSFFLFTCEVISFPWSFGSFYSEEPRVIMGTPKPWTDYTATFLSIGVRECLDLTGSSFFHKTNITFQSSVLSRNVIPEPETVPVLYPLTFGL